MVKKREKGQTGKRSNGPKRKSAHDHGVEDSGLGAGAPRQRCVGVGGTTGGDFYRGKRDDWNARLDLRPDPHFFLSAEYQQNDVRLPEGNFIVRLIRLRLSLALNADLSLFSFVQYDTVSEVLGLNTRLRWIIEPGNELFLVYNHNWSNTAGTLRPVLREGRIKVRYTYRF